MGSVKRFRKGLLFGGFAFAFFAGWVGVQVFVPTGPQGPVVLTIRRGESFPSVAFQLEQQGLIRSRRLFEGLGHLVRLPHRLRAGIYRIPSPLSSWQLVRFLSESRPQLIRLTIWEGMMSKEVAAKIEELGLGRADRFMALVRNDDNQWSLPLPFPWSGILEGLLYPDTYLFPPLFPDQEEFLLQTFIDGFLKNFWEPYLKNRPEINVQELVTIASLVQWEVKKDEERSIVAGVIRNRLARKMPLQIDATVLYALGQRKTRVLYKDLEVDSPYNTYRRIGLPPGPICSPGLESLKAALSPAKVPYHYYVARGDGGHTFTTNYADHLKAVAQYRRLMRQRWDRMKQTEKNEKNVNDE
ncbi:MAG: endolytic transglycosylase MltG [Armatimonadetes bacterium]|nr:endolytic transglycosylase MltG [Armatimonadota bacterium]MDW8121976.1 endolytic transglycosylase MltG [Armatimonadota bacterium]